MQITRDTLYRLIIEEYASAEGVSLDESKAQELIDYIRGTGPKPAWYEQDKETPPPPEVPPADIGALETMPIPRDDAPESEYQGFQNDSGAPVEDQLAALIQGMDPETVAELFQSVFEKIPGVELSHPGDEDYPDEETLYSPGAEGRPVAGFQLEQLFQLIKEVIREGDYHDMGAEDEMYDTRDAGVSALTTVQKIQKSYHALQDVFNELEDATGQDLARQIISDLETLMDTTEHPEDYRE